MNKPLYKVPEGYGDHSAQINIQITVKDNESKAVFDNLEDYCKWVCKGIKEGRHGEFGTKIEIRMRDNYTLASCANSAPESIARIFDAFSKTRDEILRKKANG